MSWDRSVTHVRGHTKGTLNIEQILPSHIRPVPQSMLFERPYSAGLDTGCQTGGCSTFNGGTITNPLTVNTVGTANSRLLEVSCLKTSLNASDAEVG